MPHEPNEKESLVEALFAAFGTEGPRDLDLFREPDAVRVTIGEARYRMHVGGEVEEVLDRVLSSSSASRAMGGRLREALSAIADRRWRSAWTAPGPR